MSSLMKVVVACLILGGVEGDAWLGKVTHVCAATAARDLTNGRGLPAPSGLAWSLSRDAATAPVLAGAPSRHRRHHLDLPLHCLTGGDTVSRTHREEGAVASG